MYLLDTSDPESKKQLWLLGSGMYSTSRHPRRQLYKIIYLVVKEGTIFGIFEKKMLAMTISLTFVTSHLISNKNKQPEIGTNCKGKKYVQIYVSSVERKG